MKTTSSLIALALAVLPPLARADDAISCNFRTLGPGIEPITLACVQKSGTSTIAVSPEERSVPYPYKGPRTLVLKEAAGSEQARDITADLPPGTDQILLLFYKTSYGALAVRALRDDYETFPAGATQFINLGRVPVGVRFGPDKFDLDPGEVKALPPGGNPSAPRFVQILRDGSGGSDPILSNNWAPNPRGRTLVLVESGTEEPPRISVKRLSEGPASTKP